MAGSSSQHCPDGAIRLPGTIARIGVEGELCTPSRRHVAGIGCGRSRILGVEVAGGGVTDLQVLGHGFVRGMVVLGFEMQGFCKVGSSGFCRWDAEVLR